MYLLKGPHKKVVIFVKLLNISFNFSSSCSPSSKKLGNTNLGNKNGSECFSCFLTVLAVLKIYVCRQPSPMSNACRMLRILDLVSLAGLTIVSGKVRVKGNK